MTEERTPPAPALLVQPVEPLKKRAANRPPALAALLKFDRRDVAGLCWIRERARFWLTALKRRRKCLPPGEPYSQEEAAAIRALITLEASAGELLGVVSSDRA